MSDIIGDFVPSEGQKIFQTANEKYLYMYVLFSANNVTQAGLVRFIAI